MNKVGFILLLLLNIGCMWEIIALYFLTKRVGLIAERKGLKSGRWKLYVVLAWFFSELIGISIAIKIYNVDVEVARNDMAAFFSSKDFMMISLIGWGFAVASYFTVKDVLQKKEDVNSKSKPYDINKHIEN